MSGTVKGYVPTPSDLADRMVELLFRADPPSDSDRILYPGVGEGPFIAAVERYIDQHNLAMPSGVAVDTHPERLDTAESTFSHLPIHFRNDDFLDHSNDFEPFDYIIGNPPYVPITKIDESRKQSYRETYQTAINRFDLYLLFYERALTLLADTGVLCFVTPEKFEYVETASALRKLLGDFHLQRLEHLDSDVFSGHLTYPTISLVRNEPAASTTLVSRDGTEREVNLPYTGDRWTELVRDIDHDLEKTGITLNDITERISPGMATGADDVFVFAANELPENLHSWAYDTVSGKELEQQSLTPGVDPKSVILCPYDESGDLLPKDRLAAIDKFKSQYVSRLRERSCVQKLDKEWYAWHENPPMQDLLTEKILFRDITGNPRFWHDTSGEIIPRHTVYYTIPKQGVNIDELREYLNSVPVRRWLFANCQRAHSDYIRLQSRVLETLPVPRWLARDLNQDIEEEV